MALPAARAARTEEAVEEFLDVRAGLGLRRRLPRRHAIGDAYIDDGSRALLHERGEVRQVARCRGRSHEKQAEEEGAHVPPRRKAALGAVPLDVAALLARVVLELAPRRVERLAQRDLRVLVVLAGHRHFAARHLEVDARAELLAVLLVPVGELEHHPAAHDVRIVLVELLRSFADRVVQGIGLLDAVEGDLKRNLHGFKIAGRAGAMLTEVNPGSVRRLRSASSASRGRQARGRGASLPRCRRPDGTRRRTARRRRTAVASRGRRLRPRRAGRLRCPPAAPRELRRRGAPGPSRARHAARRSCSPRSRCRRRSRWRRARAGPRARAPACTARGACAEARAAPLSPARGSRYPRRPRGHAALYRSSRSRRSRRARIRGSTAPAACARAPRRARRRAPPRPPRPSRRRRAESRAPADCGRDRRTAPGRAALRPPRGNGTGGPCGDCAGPPGAHVDARQRLRPRPISIARPIAVPSTTNMTSASRAIEIQSCSRSVACGMPITTLQPETGACVNTVMTGMPSSVVPSNVPSRSRAICSTTLSVAFCPTKRAASRVRATTVPLPSTTTAIQLAGRRSLLTIAVVVDGSGTVVAR